MINTEIAFPGAAVHSDFLKTLSKDREIPTLKFPRYKLSNRKFIELIYKKSYFVLPYVLLKDHGAVDDLIKEITWCSNNFRGQFAMKYITKKSRPNTDKLVIAFDNEEDRILFLLRSEIGNCGYAYETENMIRI